MCAPSRSGIKSLLVCQTSTSTQSQKKNLPTIHSFINSTSNVKSVNGVDCGHFMSFTQLQTKYHTATFFGFLQVRHLDVKSNLVPPTGQPIERPIDSFLLNFNLTASNNRTFISLFYEKLCSFNCAGVYRNRESWEKDLDVELEIRDVVRCFWIC